MKPRTWILIAGSLFLLTVISFTLLLRLESVQTELKLKVEESVRAAGVPDVHLEDLQLHLNSVDLIGLDLQVPEQGLQLRAERVTAMISFTELIRSGFNLTRGLTDLILEKPVVKLLRHAGSDRHTGQPWWKYVQQADFLQQVFISEGTVQLEDEDFFPVSLMLDGIITTPVPGMRDLQLRLGWEDSQSRPVRIQGRMNLSNTHTTLTVAADSFRIPERVLDSVLPDLHIGRQQNRLNASLNLDSIRTDWTASLEASLKGMVYHRMPAGTLNLTLEKTAAGEPFLSVRVQAPYGQLRADGTLTREGYSLQGEITSLNLDSLNKWLPPELNLAGNARLDFTSRSAWRSPQGKYQITVEDLALSGQHLGTAEFTGNLNPQSIELHSGSMTLHQGLLLVDGGLSLDLNEGTLNFNWQRTLPGDSAGIDLTGSVQTFSDGWHLSGRSLIALRVNHRLQQLSGILQGSGTTIEMHSDEQSPIRYSVLVTPGKHVRWEALVQGLEQLWYDRTPHRLNTQLHLEGDLHTASLDAELDYPPYNLVLRTSWQQGSPQLDGALNLYAGDRGVPLPGMFQLTRLDSTRYAQTMTIDENITLQGLYNTAANKYAGTVEVNDWDLQRLVDAGFSRNLPQGRVGLNLELEQAQGKWDVSGLLAVDSLHADGFTMNRLIASLSTDTEQIHVRGSASRDEQTHLQFAGDLDRNLQGWNLQARVPSVKLEQLLTGNRHIGGTLNLEVTADSERDANYTVRCRIEEPRLDRIQMDQLVLHAHSQRSLLVWQLDTLLAERQSDRYLVQLTGDGIFGSRSEPLNLHLQGDLLQLLDDSYTFVRDGRSETDVYLSMRGEYPFVRPVEGYFRLKKGRVKLPQVTQALSRIDVEIGLSEGRLRLEQFQFRNRGDFLGLTNRFEPPPGFPDMETLQIPGLDLDLGILEVRNTRNGIPTGKSVELQIPGFMEPDWSGQFLVGGEGQNNLYFGGPMDAPDLNGTIHVAGARFTWPLIKARHQLPRPIQELRSWLKQVDMNLHIAIGNANSFYRELGGIQDWDVTDYLPGVAGQVRTDIRLQPGSELIVTGSVARGTVQVLGSVESTQGSVEILGTRFTIDEAGLEFDKSDPRPIVYGRALRQVADSTGFKRDIYLTLYVLDENGQLHERGRWDKLTVSLSDDYQSSQLEILTLLGYGPGTIQSTIQTLPGTLVQGALNPFMTVAERYLQRALGMDMVQLRTDVVQRLVDARLRAGDPMVDYRSDLLAGSGILVSKSISPYAMLSYSGELFSQYENPLLSDLQLKQAINLEYKVTRNLVIMMEVGYDPILKTDERILLKYREYY